MGKSKLFSPSLKRQLKDCILAELWPKSDIYNLFRDCSIPTGTLRLIENWDSKGLSRSAMIDQVFEGLSKQTDNGTVHFGIMLNALASWSHFDDYWFRDRQTLDLETARKKIAALKIAKTEHVDSARQRADELRAKEQAKKERHDSLEEMRQDFEHVSLSSRTPQERGHAFEKFLGKMARYFGMQVTGAFKIKGTQIDGTVKFDGENDNIEAKWEHHLMSDEPLLAFCHKLEINMHGRGIFISVNGYTAGTVSMLERASVKNTVLFDGEDITLVLCEMITFPDALDRKIHAAQTRGQFYINPITGKIKIGVQ